MSQPPNTTVSVDAIAPGAAAPKLDLDLQNLLPGELWKGRYRIGEQLPDITHGKSFSALDTVSAGAVHVRSFRVVDTRRAEAWNALVKAAEMRWTPLVETFEHEGRRCEVTACPCGVSLRTLFAGKTLKTTDAQTLVSSLVEAVSALHATGVAHLNLSPDSIFVEDGSVSLAGLEAATSISGSGLVAVNQDPFYAPPETAGLYQHACGPTLLAWDWWSVGRILQELILGQHAIGLALGRDVSRRTPELMSRADNFMRGKSDVRLGAVELMKDLDPRWAILLKGLLSSCRDARWEAKQVRAWLAGEPVLERYQLSRDDRLFRWRGDAYTVAEAAEKLRNEAETDEAAKHVFQSDDPQTLVHFLTLDAKYRVLHDRVMDLTRLCESSAFEAVEAEAGREVVTGLALGLLVGAGHGLVLSGQRVSLDYVKALLASSDQPKGLRRVEALMDRTVQSHLASLDLSASNDLSEFARVAEGALALAHQHAWLQGEGWAGRARLLHFSACHDTDAVSATDAGKKRFAITRDEALNELFQKKSPSPAERAVVAATLSKPDVFRYVTHEVWLAECYAALKTRGELLARSATWLNLERMLKHGVLLFAPWPVFTLLLLCAAACIAVAYPSKPTLVMGGTVLAAGLVLRIFVGTLVRRILLARIRDAELRRGLPSSNDCRAQVVKLIGPGAAKAVRLEIQREHEEVNRAIVALPPSADRPVVASPATFNSLRLGGLVFSLGLLAAIFGLGQHIVRNPPTWPDLKLAWFPPEASPTAEEAKTEQARSAAEQAKSNAASKPEDDYLEKVAWPYKRPEAPGAARIAAETEATAQQQRTAEERAAYLLRGYKPSTINGLLAVRLSSEPDFSYVLFDGASGKIADKRVFRLAYLPMARSWLDFAGKPAIFLEN